MFFLLLRFLRANAKFRKQWRAYNEFYAGNLHAWKISIKRTAHTFNLDKAKPITHARGSLSSENDTIDAATAASKNIGTLTKRPFYLIKYTMRVRIIIPLWKRTPRTYYTSFVQTLFLFFFLMFAAALLLADLAT